MPQCIYSCNQASIRVLVVILLHNIVKLAAEVFSLLKHLFGEEQLNAIKDYLQAALKLNYNDRVVG